jgi:hypothetical protein
MNNNKPRHNNPIPPRSRARCCADSPRRGEYGALGGRLRGAAIDEIAAMNNP